MTLGSASDDVGS